jgi:hypothetical protein
MATGPSTRFRCSSSTTWEPKDTSSRRRTSTATASATLVVPGLWIYMNKGVPHTFSDDVYDPQNPQGHPFGNGLFGLPEVYFLGYSQVRHVTADFDNDG